MENLKTEAKKPIKFDKAPLKPVEGKVVNKSPLPKKDTETRNQLNFLGAISIIIGGGKATRIEWGNKDYGIVKDGFLMIYTKDKFHQWIISDGDINAKDWVIVE